MHSRTQEVAVVDEACSTCYNVLISNCAKRGKAAEAEIDELHWMRMREREAEAM